MYKVFEQNKKSHLEQPIFFGETPNIARYDVQSYPIFEKLIDKSLGFFWLPQEVDLTKDQKDFKELSDGEKHIFLSNLKYQILLDSIQGRAPNIAFLPIVSDPTLETLIETWSFFEGIHSRSYTHIIRNLIPNPSEVFDNITNIKEITERTVSVTKYYDELIKYSSMYNLFGYGSFTVMQETGKSLTITITPYILKELLYKTMISVNILEGIRFYVSFACSWAFCELKKMEGNAKIIELIARDENIHLATTQNIIKHYRLSTDTDIIKIVKENENFVYKMYDDAINEEKAWAKYLFKDAAMIGLNTELLCDYVEYMANKRMRTIGLKQQYNQPHNPLSWTNNYLKSDNKQVAPMETEISTYIQGGGLKSDIDENTFDNFEL